MRPRKPVLLYCSDKEQLDDLMFLLSIRCGWAYMKDFSKLADMKKYLSTGNEFCCIIFSTNGSEDLRSVVTLPEAQLRSIEFTKKGEGPSLAGRVVKDFAVLLEAMRIVSARKRGPKARLAA
jgi:hypothetical protein